MYILYTCICVGVRTVVCCVLKYVRSCSMNVSVDYCECMCCMNHMICGMCVLHIAQYTI